MKRQKSFFLFLLIVMLICVLLTACGHSRSNGGSANSTASGTASSSPATSFSSVSPSASTEAIPGAVSSSAAESVPSASSSFSASVTELSLWCTEGAASAELVRYADLFNADTDDVSLQVTTFSDEGALAEALSASSPDLLYCSRLLPDSLGLSVQTYDTLGFDVPVLLVNTVALESASGSADLLNGCSFENLCKLASDAYSGTPYLAAESFTSVFENCLLSSGSRLSADRNVNIGNPDYISVYNHLAECAYSGNLVTNVQDLSSFRSCNVVCMFTSSAQLAGQNLDGLTVNPFPLPENFSGEPSLAITQYGFAVLSDRSVSLEKIRSFSLWLENTGYSSSLALTAGLVPSSSGSFPSDALSETLNCISSGYHLVDLGEARLPEADRISFDLDCRSAFSAF